MKLERWEVELLMNAAIKLTEIKHNKCTHLCIESMAPMVFSNLVAVYIDILKKLQESAPI